MRHSPFASLVEVATAGLNRVPPGAIDYYSQQRTRGKDDSTFCNRGGGIQWVRAQVPSASQKQSSR